MLFRSHTESLPTYEGALAAARDGVRTGGHARNLDYVSGHLMTAGIDPAFEALCLDPQTSGGLLAAVHPSVAGRLEGFTVVGEVLAGPAAVELV